MDPTSLANSASGSPVVFPAPSAPGRSKAAVHRLLLWLSGSKALQGHPSFDFLTGLKAVGRFPWADLRLRALAAKEEQRRLEHRLRAEELKKELEARSAQPKIKRRDKTSRTSQNIYIYIYMYRYIYIYIYRNKENTHMTTDTPTKTSMFVEAMDGVCLFIMSTCRVWI